MSYETEIDRLTNFVIEKMALKREIIRLRQLVKDAYEEGVYTSVTSDDDLRDAWDGSQAKENLVITPNMNQVTL